MTFVAVILAIIIVVSVVILRLYLFSLFTYFSTKLEPKKTGFEALNSLRQSLIHERKKKAAGLEMILSSWEKGEEIQPRYEYFEELLDQLKDLVRSEKRNLMAVSPDLWLWAKLWSILRQIEKHSKENRERSDVAMLRQALAKLRELLDQTVEAATRKFSFSLNHAVKESVKTVRIEKSRSPDIEIREQLDEVGESIRFSYAGFKEWQRLLTNLIRNAIEAVEAKQSAGAGVAADFSLRGGEDHKVIVSTEEAGDGLVSVIIEDSGIGMDEATRSTFFKKGFTSGKEHGLGLGMTEESIQFVEQYGRWEIKSEKGVGTRISINIDKEKSKRAELLLPPPKPFFRTRLAFGLYSLLVILLGLALRFAFDKYSRFWVDWNPAFAKLAGENKVVVETKDGRFLWDRSFGRSVRETSLAVADIDSDGTKEVLIGTESGLKETGHLFCFSSRGDELWRFALGAEGIFQVPSNRYSFDRVIVRDLNLDGESDILASGENNPWFPYQIALLDSRGRVQTSYWHAGAITLLLCDDVDSDGNLEMVCGGGNNRLQFSAILAVLECGVDWGQSPPYTDPVLPMANEKIYVKFPFVRGLGGENDRFSFVKEFIYAGRENGSDVYIITVHDHRGFKREYHLDREFTYVKRLIVHPDQRLLWEKLKRERVIGYDLTPEIIESWKEIEVWKNGVKIR